MSSVGSVGWFCGVGVRAPGPSYEGLGITFTLLYVEEPGQHRESKVRY